MAEARKRPCTICRRWFRPEPRVGQQQRACRNPQCQAKRRQRAQADWRRRNPDYGAAYRLQQRSTQTDPPAEPLRLPPPLNRLPWDVAKDQFGRQGADFIGIMGSLIVRAAKDEFRPYPPDSTGVSHSLPTPPRKPSASLPHTVSQADEHAIGVSPTRPPMGAPASPPPAATAASAGLTG